METERINSAHTPTPWHVTGYLLGASTGFVPIASAHHEDVFCISSTNRALREEGVANAELIVRAVNAHDALVVALRVCASELDSEAENYRDDDEYQPHGKHLHALADKARAALAQPEAVQ